jgi:carboxymethylenebutenolidase
MFHALRCPVAAAKLPALAITVAGLLVSPRLVWAQTDPARQRLEQSRRHHEYNDVSTPAGRTVRVFVVYPEVDKPVPGVVIIHENRGLTDWERGLADQLAEAGYVAVAPDLLSQTGPGGGGTESYESRDAAREGIYKLPPEQVIADLDAVVEYTRALEATTDAVAVCGFCWGGGQCFRFAAHNDQIKAAFVFYGPAPAQDVLTKVKVPVYGFYGGNDFRITGQVPRVAEAMKEAGLTFEPVVYENAGHGFMRSGESESAPPADRTAREQAWKRWKELLARL